jgi:hypothetical protein
MSRLKSSAPRPSRSLVFQTSVSPSQRPLPDVDVPMVERIAAGKADHQEILAWLSDRVRLL